MQAFELRGAGAVLHSHSLNAVMATLIDEDAREFKVTHLEMIKVLPPFYILFPPAYMVVSSMTAVLQAIACDYLFGSASG